MDTAFRTGIVTLLTVISQSVAVAADMPLADRRSGYEDMSAATRQIQDDDTSNPAMLVVLDGEALWREKVGPTQKACGDCHGDPKSSMKGVAARYPTMRAGTKVVVNLEGRINLCRHNHQAVPEAPYESQTLLALTAFVAHQSRGSAIDAASTDMADAVDAGRQIFMQRQGQLNLSCANCHDDNWGRKLGGSSIPQGHPTGYPMYRLEWQSVGSLHRRLRNCLSGMRAENVALGSPELIALEAYLMWRARGMAIETPAVRP